MLPAVALRPVAGHHEQRRPEAVSGEKALGRDVVDHCRKHDTLGAEALELPDHRQEQYLPDALPSFGPHDVKVMDRAVRVEQEVPISFLECSVRVADENRPRFSYQDDGLGAF